MPNLFSNGSRDNVPESINEEIRLFNRLLIAYNDFKQSHEIASLLIDGNLYENYPRNNRTLVQALNMAAIVAYARPFVASRGTTAQSRIPRDVLDVLVASERSVHDTVIHDRNTMMAHSDSDANQALPLVYDPGHGEIILPVNASPYVRTLLPETMKILAGMAYKLREEVFDRRCAMEPHLIEHLPVVEWGLADG